MSGSATPFIEFKKTEEKTSRSICATLFCPTEYERKLTTAKKIVKSAQELPTEICAHLNTDDLHTLKESIGELLKDANHFHNFLKKLGIGLAIGIVITAGSTGFCAGSLALASYWADVPFFTPDVMAKIGLVVGAKAGSFVGSIMGAGSLAIDTTTLDELKALHKLIAENESSHGIGVLYQNLMFDQPLADARHTQSL
jgi:hypothetical protein